MRHRYPKTCKVEVYRASAEEYFSTIFLKGYMSQLQHAWASCESKAVSYNETWRGTARAKFCEDFVTANPSVGGHFDAKSKKDQSRLVNDQEEDAKDEDSQDYHATKKRIHELGKKNLRTAFYHHEVTGLNKKPPAWYNPIRLELIYDRHFYSFSYLTNRNLGCRQ